MTVVRDPIFGCELAQGRADGDGYVFDGRDRAHRTRWAAANGPIAADMVLDHLCRRRACVALHHLELVDQAENEKRKSHRYRARRRFCRANHPLAVTRIVTPEGGQVCRDCNTAARSAP